MSMAIAERVVEVMKEKAKGASSPAVAPAAPPLEVPAVYPFPRGCSVEMIGLPAAPSPRPGCQKTTGRL